MLDKMENVCFPMPIQSNASCIAHRAHANRWFQCGGYTDTFVMRLATKHWWHSIYLTQLNISNHFIFMWFVNLSVVAYKFCYCCCYRIVFSQFCFFLQRIHWNWLLAGFQVEQINISNELFPFECDFSWFSFFFHRFHWFVASIQSVQK